MVVLSLKDEICCENETEVFKPWLNKTVLVDLDDEVKAVAPIGI